MPVRLRSFSALLVTAALASATLTAPPHATAQEPPRQPAAKRPEPLPPGVVARVYGKDITAEELRTRLTAKFEGTRRGEEVVDQLIEDICVHAEAKKREIQVTDEDAREYLAKVDAKVRRDSGETKSLRDVYAEQDTSEAEFLDVIREFLLRQKMARQDFGGGSAAGTSQFGIEGDVPTHRMKLWVKSLRARYDVKTDGLAEGVLAEVNGRSVTRQDFAASMIDRLPADVVKGLRDDLIFEAAVAKHLADAGVELTDEDVNAEMARLRQRFAEDPRVKGSGATFDQFLKQTNGVGEASLVQDPSFRARLGLRRLLLGNVTPERIRAHWEANRDAYGDQALLRQVFLPARSATTTSNFEGLKTFEEVHDLMLDAKVRILRLSGVGSGGDAPDMSLADAVSSVAKALYRNPEQQRKAGELEAWTRARVASERALLDKAFEGDLNVLLGPIRSSVGYHLLLVEERRAAPRFEEITDKLREDVLRQDMLVFRRTVHLGEHVITPDKLGSATPPSEER